MDSAIRIAAQTWEGEANSFSGNMLTAIARMVDAYGSQLKEDVFKEHAGKASVKSIIRSAKERQRGSLGYAECMVNLYNTKNKYRLSVRRLYGGKDSVDEAEGQAEKS